MIAFPIADSPEVADAVAALRTSPHWVLIAQQGSRDVMILTSAPEGDEALLAYMNDTQGALAAAFDLVRRDLVGTE